MRNFQVRRLDELMTAGEISLGRGDVISKDDIANHPGPYPIYSSSAQNNGLFGEYGKFMFDEELISWSVDGGGYFFYRPKHRYSVTNVCGYMRIRPERWHPKFVYYSLVNQHRFLTFDYTSKAHPSVIKKQYRLPAIGVDRQRKIATILSTIDTAIEQTEALIEKYQHIKAGLMHDLFTRGVLPTGQLRPPREQAPELYQETAIGWIPREWRLTQARQLCSLITKGTTPASADMWESSEGIRFLRVDNLTFDGRFDFTASSYRISELTHTITLSRSKCISGDVLMNIVGPPLGKVSLVTAEIGEVNINQAIALFRPTASLSPIYLLRWLLSSSAKRWFLQRAKQTSGQLNLTLAMCQGLEIPLPSIEEQGLMEMRLQAAEGLVQSEMIRLTKLRAKKLGLMQDLLTGKVPVSVDVAPSEALA